MGIANAYAGLTMGVDTYDAAVAGLQSRVDELTRRLQHMLDWRVHIGRHHFWRRPNAKV
jgi:hypothetical protein